MNAHRKEHTCVVGLGWGDEGKGKIVDLLCPDFDFVIRFNGGANAGHTVCVGDQKFALHLLPAGVLHESVVSVIGPGVVVDPLKLIDELDALASRGIDALSRLRISDRAHLVLAYHKIEDQLGERNASASNKIGTTSRGIGPCYADKMRRTTAVRFTDLLHDDELEQRVRRIVAMRKTTLGAAFGDDGGLDEEQVMADLYKARRRLNANVCDTTSLLHNAMADGRRLLFEGANGVLLDIDHGTYPFVTSSSTGSHGIGPGAGVPPSAVSRVIGVCKAYSTRVGAGPFVTELRDDIGDRIRVQGHEFGTTTGRPRRCGWFDAVACRYAARLSSVTDVALLHVDTLTGFGQVGICTGYSLDGKVIEAPPAHVRQTERVEPIYEMLPGWSEDLRGVRSFDDLPVSARRYVERIESLLGTRVTLIGVGPERTQTLARDPLDEFVSIDQPTVV